MNMERKTHQQRKGASKLGTIFFLLWVFFVSHATAAEKTILVKQVEFQGTHQSDSVTLLSKIGTRAGSPFSPSQIADDIRLLYSLGYFTQIEARSEKIGEGEEMNVLFVVTEMPILAEVVFEGNKTLDTEKLKGKVTLKTGFFMNEQAVKKNAKAIQQLYEEEGLHQAQVTPVFKTVSPDAAKIVFVKVVFVIQEGTRVYVKRVQFRGNHLLSQHQLEGLIETKAYFALTSWWNHSGRYQEAVLEQDAERIRSYYLNHGYLQVQIDEPTVSLSQDKGWLGIEWIIKEGKPFTLGRIAYEGNKLFTVNDLARETGSRVGAVVSRDQIRQDISNMIDRYGKKGHIFANVIPQVIPNPNTQTADLTFQVNEDEAIRVREIHITGNDKTRDNVIRRSIQIGEQKQFNTDLLRQSYRRLQNLDFFEAIQIVPKKVASDLVDLEVSVKEKQTGTFNIGGGYSSVDNLVGTADVTLSNFLGKGQILKAKVDTGKKRRTYSLSFREPAIFDGPLSASASVYNQTRSFVSSYDEKRVGGNIGLGRSFGNDVNVSGSILIESLDYKITDPVNAPPLLQSGTTHGVELFFSRDTRDFIFDPKTGHKISLSGTYAGTFLGGDNNYYKAVLDTGQFFPLWIGHVLSLHGRMGYAHGIEENDLPQGERFFVGGINTVRGFRYGKAGPFFPTTGEIKGGDKELLFNVEYLVPLGAENRFKAVFFYDRGAGFDNGQSVRWEELRQSAGAGLRFTFPGIGPLRMEWGWNLDRQSGEAKVVSEFSIGTTF